MSVSCVDLGFVANHRFGRELDFSGFEDGVLLEDVLLRLVMAKRLQTHRRTHARPKKKNCVTQTEIKTFLFHFWLLGHFNVTYVSVSFSH